VLTLGYTRKCVRLLAWRSSARIWAELHEKAFRRLGGCPRVVVLDNLKEGVLVPDVYDPTINPLFRDVLAHYGVVALPCRIRDADRKGKVESGVGYTKKTPLKGMRFESLEEAQAYLDRWEERWADTRIHGTTKRQVGVMFAEEKTALAAPDSGTLPLSPIRRTRGASGWLRGSGGRYYNLPPGWIGRLVKVQWDELHVRILHPNTSQLLREHLRQKRGGYLLCLGPYHLLVHHAFQPYPLGGAAAPGSRLSVAPSFLLLSQSSHQTWKALTNQESGSSGYQPNSACPKRLVVRQRPLNRG
jgi:hypothetical protein